MRKKHVEYEVPRCPTCNQSTTYLLAIDSGTAHIVKRIAQFIGGKGINAVHPRKEMEKTGWLTSNEVGNLSRPRSHGLIAQLKGEPGNYCLTKKGSDFLRGGQVPAIAIMSKCFKKQIGYLEPEKYTCVISDFDTAGHKWEGINYEIVEGRIIKSTLF